MPIVFVFWLAPFFAEGQTCEQTLQEAKKAYKNQIEKEFLNCDDNIKCINKVSQKAKKHPYFKQYKKCKRSR